MCGLASPKDGAVARQWFMPMAHRLFSITKMTGSLYRLAMLSDS
jgi:hypothetical protein